MLVIIFNNKFNISFLQLINWVKLLTNLSSRCLIIIWEFSWQARYSGVASCKFLTSISQPLSKSSLTISKLFDWTAKWRQENPPLRCFSIKLSSPVNQHFHLFRLAGKNYMSCCNFETINLINKFFQIKCNFLNIYLKIDFKI